MTLQAPVAPPHDRMATYISSADALSGACRLASSQARMLRMTRPVMTIAILWHAIGCQYREREPVGGAYAMVGVMTTPL